MQDFLKKSRFVVMLISGNTQNTGKAVRPGHRGRKRKGEQPNMPSMPQMFLQNIRSAENCKKRCFITCLLCALKKTVTVYRHLVSSRCWSLLSIFEISFSSGLWPKMVLRGLKYVILNGNIYSVRDWCFDPSLNLPAPLYICIKFKNIKKEINQLIISL